MPLIEILEVKNLLLDDDSLVRGAVESIKTGQLFEGESLSIEGWVLRREGVAAVEIDQDGNSVRRIQPDRARPDVQERFPQIPDSGRCGFQSSLKLQEWKESKLSVWAVSPPAERIAIAEIRARRRWRERAELGEAPLVSIVVAAGYFSEPGLASIESILAQSYPHLEVLIVSPAPERTARRLARAQRGLRVVKSDRSGLASAWNTGIRRTSGDFLLFLESRDRLEPVAVERGLAAFRESPESALLLGHRRSRSVTAPPTPGGARCDSTAGLALFRRSAFESVGVFNPHARKPHSEMIRRVARRFPFHCHHETIVGSLPKERRFRTLSRRLISLLRRRP